VVNPTGEIMSIAASITMAEIGTTFGTLGWDDLPPTMKVGAG